MFEFAFMPIALQCANDREKFQEYFSDRLINKFVETFFSRKQRSNQNLHDVRGNSIREEIWIWQNI